jgi:hypothetical protein
MAKEHGHEGGTPGSDSPASSGRSTLRVDNESRKPRTLKEMEEEAEWLKTFISAEDSS